MTDILRDFFLQKVGKTLCVFFCAMIPVVELRGSIPMGAAFGLPIWQTYLYSVVGNMLPVPFILLFIRALIGWMKKTKLFSRFALWLERKAEKGRAKIDRYTALGLILFVAIPLPGTGAWTGSLVAALMGVNFKKSFFSVFAGVLVAGVVMTMISYGVSTIVQLF